MTYDLIIVTASIHDELIKFTQQAIDTCRKDTKDVNVILIESGRPYKYKNINRTIEYNGEFNYNRALNLGLKYAKADVQILANNDIIFHPGWSKIGYIMQENDYLSACALSGDYRQRYFQRGDYAYEGYVVGFQMSGWCIFAAKELWGKIGKLSEKYNFWFSDNAYGEQLREKGIKHALICSIQVDHIGSQTLKRVTRKTQYLYTSDAERKVLNERRHA